PALLLVAQGVDTRRLRVRDGEDLDLALPDRAPLVRLMPGPRPPRPCAPRASHGRALTRATSRRAREDDGWRRRVQGGRRGPWREGSHEQASRHAYDQKSGGSTWAWSASSSR